MNETTAITKRPMLDAIVENKAKFAARLPAGFDAEKFTLGVTTAIQKNPDLLLCDPKSVILAAYDAAELGISLSPALALGWLIPYKTQCVFQVSYRGLMQKARETKEVKNFFAEVVYECDKFERQFAPKRNLFHAPGDEDARIKGNVIGAYAFIEFIDGTIDWEYLTTEQIERRRKHSKNPNSLMWATFWEEGYRKTPIRVLWKRLPLTNQSMERLAEAIAREADIEAEPEPAGRLEIEPDPITKPPKANIPPASYPPELHPDAEVVTKPISVFYHVGKEITLLKGDVKKIVDRLPKIGAKYSKEYGAWAMPAARTYELVELLQQSEVTFAETDADGALLTSLHDLPKAEVRPDELPDFVADEGTDWVEGSRGEPELRKPAAAAVAADEKPAQTVAQEQFWPKHSKGGKKK
jgi:recombination protein RecT